MANKEHIAILKRGVRAWNQWRTRNEESSGDTKPESVDLSGANLIGTLLMGVNFRNVNLNQADFAFAYLYSADLSGADLGGANLDGTYLNHANLSHANLRRAKLLGARMNSAILYSADLGAAKLIHTRLIGANLGEAELGGADLTIADLSNARLGGADLTAANLGNTNLSGADLRGVKLASANFHRTDLRSANFENARISSTRFTDCDLSEIKGLDLAYHRGPSTIGVDTIYRSKGEIPENFLRGCGVPNGLITQMRSLIGAEKDIQFYSCFISHSHKDNEFARRVHGRMRDANLRVWFAPEDIQAGKKLHEQIESAIRVYDKLLIVLSEASLQSEWVMDELRKGFKAERDTRKRKLFPVRLIDYETLKRWECRDSISGKDLAEEVRQYFIPDFSNWKDHDSFEAAFDRLLKDLRADSNSRS